jgi:hypothetical protein
LRLRRSQIETKFRANGPFFPGRRKIESAGPSHYSG